MAKKIIIEIEIDMMLISDTNYTIEVADKIQENIIESATKTIKKWNRWNSTQIKTISLNSKVE